MSLANILLESLISIVLGRAYCNSLPQRYVTIDKFKLAFLFLIASQISKNLTLGLTSLRSVRADSKLGWTKTEEKTQETEDLSDLLSDLDAEKPLGVEPGVWVF